MVNQNFLPPVGYQIMPNCFVWSSAYGAATFWAAQSSYISPTTSNLQASPDYTYIKGDSKQRPDRVLQGLTDYERPQLSGRQQGNAIASSGAELRKLLQELDRLPKRLDDFTRLSELCHSWLWLDDRHRP